MHTLERIAEAFEAWKVPLMALKGAALNLTLYDRPHQRPMSDLDLMVRPQDVDRAVAILEDIGAKRGEEFVRDDFFPRFYAEVEYNLGTVYPVRIDLHVRPLRPLRFARQMPCDALWTRSELVRIGGSRVHIPGPEDMLIHLAGHSGLHGNCRTLWLRDIRDWVAARRERMDWERFLTATEAWGLTLPVREAIVQAEAELGSFCPRDVVESLQAQRVGWRDRLAMAQAPRDATHPASHIAVDVLCTPGWRYTLSYLWAVAVPDTSHMASWYGRTHFAWLPCAHVLRALWPLLRHVPMLAKRSDKFEVRTNRQRETRVYAKRDILSGEVIARCEGKRIPTPISKPCWSETRGGKRKWFALAGPLGQIQTSDRPNAKLCGRELIAVRPIRDREEITVALPADARRQTRSQGDATATSEATRSVEAA